MPAFIEVCEGEKCVNVKFHLINISLLIILTICVCYLVYALCTSDHHRRKMHMYKEKCRLDHYMR